MVTHAHAPEENSGMMEEHMHDCPTCKGKALYARLNGTPSPDPARCNHNHHRFSSASFESLTLTSTAPANGADE